MNYANPSLTWPESLLSRTLLPLIGLSVAVLLAVGIIVSYEVSPLAGAGVLGVIAMLALGAKFPEFSLAVLYVGMFVWSLVPQADVISGYRVPVTLVWVAACFGLHALIVDGRGFRFTFTRVDALLLLFSSYIGISLFWSNNKFYGTWKLLLFISLSAATSWFFRAFYLARMARLKQLVKWLGAMAVLPLAMIVSVCLQVGDLNGLMPGQYYSERRILFDELFTVYGASDALMISGLCIAFMILESRRFSVKLLWGGLLMADLWGLLILGQRAQFVITIVCAVLLYWRLRQSGKALVTPSKVAAFVLTLGLLAAGAWAQTQFNVRSSVDWMKDDTSLENRAVAYRIAIQAFLDNPILGLGVGNYEEYSRANASKYLGDVGEVGSKMYTDVTRSFPHNTFLEIMAENGVIGLLLWCLFMWVAVQAVITALRRKDGRFDSVLALACVWLLARLVICLGAGDLATLAFGPPLALVGLATALRPSAAKPIGPADIQRR